MRNPSGQLLKCSQSRFFRFYESLFPSNSLNRNPSLLDEME